MASGSRNMANSRRQDDGPESELSDAIMPHGEGTGVPGRGWLSRMPTRIRVRVIASVAIWTARVSLLWTEDMTLVETV